MMRFIIIDFYAQGIGLNHLQLNLNAFELNIKINYINLQL